MSQRRRRLWVLVAFASGCLGCIGGGRVVVRYDQQEGAPHAAAIAVSLVEPLRRLEASLDHWRTCLDRGSCSNENFLRETESQLLGILGEPELAALRDWVAEGFGVARGELAAAVAPQVRLASMRAPEQAGIGSIFESISEMVLEVREIAERKLLLTDLCVVTTPVDGASFELWPRSAPSQIRKTTSSGKLVDLYRGLYSYRVERQGYRPLLCDPKPGTGGCPRLNLAVEPPPVLACDLKAGRCSGQPGPLEACAAAP